MRLKSLFDTRPPRPNTRISEEQATTVLPDSILSRMLEEDVITGPYKPTRPVVRRRMRWTSWLIAAVALILTAASLKGLLS